LTDNTPFFTIGVPTFNRIELLKQTIHSILEQTYTDYEVIIANDYVDKPLSIKELGFNDERIIIINNNENLGEANNMNHILSKAKGKYFAWQFDDDIYGPTFFESILKLFNKNKQLNCIYTNYGFIYGKNYPSLSGEINVNEKIYSGEEFVQKALIGKISVAGCCGVFNRSSLIDIGGIETLSNTPIAIHSEFLLLINCLRFKTVGYLDSPLFYSRDYEGTYSGSTKDFESYKIAGINLLDRGIQTHFIYSNNDPQKFIISLINTIYEFFLMRLYAVKDIKYSDHIDDLNSKIINVLRKRKICKDEELILTIKNKVFSKTWIKVRIKAILKWHTPPILGMMIKKVRVNGRSLN